VEPIVLAVPTYNSARYLPATLESLNAQDGWVRWWLQDGASTDGTVEIARSLARSGDTVVSEPDQGQTDALNRAMRQMGGEIIGFLNGDDCLLPGAAQAVMEFFAANPQVDLVCGGIQWIDEAGRVAGTHAGAIHSLEEVLDIYSVWWNDRQWVQPEVFYRRRLWETVGGFDTGYHLAFDYDFWVRCFRANARVGHLPRELAQFRKHGEQKSTAAERAAEEIRAIVQKHLESSVPIDPALRRRLERNLAYDRFRTGESASGVEGRREFARALLRHPEWLLLRNVRDRLAVSFRERLGGRGKGTAGKARAPQDI